jgi:hypothetical protein
MENMMIKKIAWAIIPLLFLVTCTTEDTINLSEYGLPKISDMDITISIDTTNQVTFHIDNTECVPIWIFSDDDRVAWHYRFVPKE